MTQIHGFCALCGKKMQTKIKIIKNYRKKNYLCGENFNKKTMETINAKEEYTGLNSAQLHFLQLLSHIKTEETMSNLKRIIRDFYSHQLQKEANKYWEEGKISDGLLNEHLRSPYK